MAVQPVIRDLIYLDVEKAASIHSQIAGGLTRETQQLLDSISSSRSEAGISAGFARAGWFEAEAERSARLETKVLHHDMLARIEEVLFAKGLAVDINDSPPPVSKHAAREALGDAVYIRATGRVILEDYERLKSIAENFNQLLAVIARSAAGDAIADDQRITQLQVQLERAQSEYLSMEGNRKAQALARVVQAQQEIQARVLAHAGLEGPADSVIGAVTLWVDTFMPGRIALRVFPFATLPDFQVVANLKRDAFVDADLDTLRLAYGTMPDQELSVFGLVTSAPPAEPDSFDPLAGLPGHIDTSDGEESDDATDEKAAFEAAFRALFPAADGLEGFVRFVRFPSVTVHPIAAYRTIRLPPEEDLSAEDGRFGRFVKKLMRA